MQFEALVAENKKKADEVKGMMEFITGELNDYKQSEELKVIKRKNGIEMSIDWVAWFFASLG